MRKILSGRRGSGKGSFQMRVNTATQTQYGFTTPSATNQFYFPITDGTDNLGYTINFTIDWGDGQTSNVNSSNYATACLHTYSTPGTYTISAEGNIAGFNFWEQSQNTGKADGNKLLEITRWGDLKLTAGKQNSSGQVFRSCVNLSIISAPDTPWFPGHPNNINLNSRGGRATFSGCTSLTTINNIANWDVSRLSAMQIMFSGCSKLQSGSNGGAPIDLSNWDVGNVSQFERTFNNCSVINPKIFTNIGAKVSTIPSMKSMFRNCANFDNNNTGTMNSWNTSKVLNMDFMFDGCAIFNDNISSWDTSSVTTMREMFKDCPNFNQNISGWDTSGVVDMRDMFTDATAFDQPIGNWNVNAWNVSTVGTSPMTGPSTTFKLSTANYDALLIAWDAAYSFPSWPGGTVDFGNSQYSLANPSAVSARTSLANKWGTLNDGGGI